MRRAERVVDVDVGERCQLLRERRVVLFLLGMEAKVLEQDHLRSARHAPRRRRWRAGSPTQSSANDTSRFSSSPRRAATGCRLNSGCRLALRPPEMRGEDDGRTALQRVLDRRQRRRDAGVVGDATVLDRDVEVDADEHARARETQIANEYFGILGSTDSLRTQSLKYRSESLWLVVTATGVFAADRRSGSSSPTRCRTTPAP